MNLSGTKLPAIELARIRISNHHRFSQQCFKLRSAGTHPCLRRPAQGRRRSTVRGTPGGVGTGILLRSGLEPWSDHDVPTPRHKGTCRYPSASLSTTPVYRAQIDKVGLRLLGANADKHACSDTSIGSWNAV